MRLPNGYGSVFKLKGKRRRPWVARRTVGYNDRGQQIYEYVGYYETRAAALEALAGRSDPKKAPAVTVAEVWEMYEERILSTRADSTQRNNQSLWHKWVSQLAALPIDQISLERLQDLTDTVPAPSQGGLLTLVHSLLQEAVRREILPAGSENVTRYVERAKYVPPKKEIFSEDQIAQLWQKSDEPLFALALVLIYTGLRLGELMALTPEQASGEFLEIRQSKTAAGVRTVPVHHRIRPLVPAALAWASVRTDRAVRWQWRHVLAPLGLPATAHCARHTCVTRLVEAGVDPRLVRTIVGHAGGSVTDDVYTHVRPEVLLEAIERLP